MPHQPRLPRKTRARAAFEAAEALHTVQEAEADLPPEPAPDLPDDYFAPPKPKHNDLAARSTGVPTGSIGYISPVYKKASGGLHPAWDMDEVIAAIRRYEGNLNMAAKMLGVTRRMLDYYRRDQPEVQAVCQEEWESRLDNVEGVLYNRALHGEGWAVCFMLKTQGRGRGYMEREVSLNMKLDLNQLNDEQLRRIANGEHPAVVMGGPRTSGAGSAETGPDGNVVEGETRLLMGGPTEAEAGATESGD